MPLYKDDKKRIAKQYKDSIDAAKNVVVVTHQGVPVNAINKLRMDVVDNEGSLQVVKKRVFLKSIEGSYEGLDPDQMNGSVAILMSNNEDDEHAPLKAVQKHVKQRKKDKEEYGIGYVGGRYEGAEWRDSTYVSELANLPSREELIGKFLFMLNHPVSSFARVLDAIAKREPVEEGAQTGGENGEVVKEELSEEVQKEDATEGEAVSQDTPAESGDESSSEE